MKREALLSSVLTRPPLTRSRVVFAFAVALLTDALQIGLGPLGWAFIDEGLDVLAMLLISAAVGFHTLLLPTFVIELIPGPDMLPTWTGCTAVVIALRRRKEPTPPVVDIQTEVTSAPAQPPTPPPVIAQGQRTARGPAKQK